LNENGARETPDKMLFPQAEEQLLVLIGSSLSNLQMSQMAQVAHTVNFEEL
jgi:hypothetical protein